MTIIPLTSGLSGKQEVRQKMGQKNLRFLYFCLHFFAFLFSFGRAAPEALLHPWNPRHPWSRFS
jgi:hypothetical protein